jgi:hypothetical protein
MLHAAEVAMIVRTALHAVVAALCVALCSCTNAPAAEEKPAVTEWQVQHCPTTVSGSCLGYFGPKPSGWYLSVNSAGEAELTLQDGKDTRRQFRVSPEQQRALQKAILDEKFFELSEDYGDLVVDGSTRTLTICVGQMVKTVQVHYLMNGGKGDPATLREPARALRVVMLVRSWISDPDAIDLTKYDQKVLDAAGR